MLIGPASRTPSAGRRCRRRPTTGRAAAIPSGWRRRRRQHGRPAARGVAACGAAHRRGRVFHGRGPQNPDDVLPLGRCAGAGWRAAAACRPGAGVAPSALALGCNTRGRAPTDVQRSPFLPSCTAGPTWGCGGPSRRRLLRWRWRARPRRLSTEACTSGGCCAASAALHVPRVASEAVAGAALWPVCSPSCLAGITTVTPFPGTPGSSSRARDAHPAPVLLAALCPACAQALGACGHRGRRGGDAVGQPPAVCPPQALAARPDVQQAEAGECLVSSCLS